MGSRVVLLCALTFLGYGFSSAAHAQGPIVVGSKNFTESRLLGEILAQLIEGKLGMPVKRRANLGGTIMVFNALRTGQVDLYAEYTGTAWTVQLGKKEPVRDPLRAYLEVQRAFRAKHQLEWLMPLGFNNSYALAMREELAAKLAVRRLSDLRAHQDRLRVAVSHEFLHRPDGFPGLAKAYGLHFVNLRGMEHGLAYEALGSGKVDLIDTYTTDGKLLRYRVRLLEDDRRFFPPYQAAPVVRAEALRRHPRLREVLDRLAFRLTDRRMRALNHRVSVERGSFAQVARDFLREEGLVGAGPTGKAVAPSRDTGFFAFFWSRIDKTLELTAQHLYLTGVAVLFAILFAVPLGIALTRSRVVAPVVMNAAGVIQTIPSLALLAFMIPLPGLGLGARSAIAALFLYALLPILRNTYAGIRAVDADLVEAARGMGLKNHQILWRVELPLASRTIMAGIRTSSVISVGVATLAAFIGAGGLGEPILTGLQLNDVNLILAGALPAAALAVVVDLVLGLVERWLAPRGLAP